MPGRQVAASAGLPRRETQRSIAATSFDRLATQSLPFHLPTLLTVPLPLRRDSAPPAGITPRPTAASQRSRGGAPCRGAGVAWSEPCTDAPETETCPCHEARSHEARGHEARGHEATPESDGPAWGAGAGTGRGARGAGRASDWIIDIVWKTTDWLCPNNGLARQTQRENNSRLSSLWSSRPSRHLDV